MANVLKHYIQHKHQDADIGSKGQFYTQEKQDVKINEQINYSKEIIYI